jgi:O-antigen/teichoic acid export membrane protein
MAEGGSVAQSSGLARGTILGMLAQGWQLVTAFVLYHYLAAKLGPAGFGQWRVALSVLVYFEMIVNIGIVQVATKRLSEAPEDTPRLERAAYFGQAVLAIGLFAVALVTAGPIAAALRDPSLAFLLRIAALDIPLVAAFMVASSIRLGHQNFERQALGMTAYATAKFVAIGLLVWRGFSVPGALVGNALASLVGFAVMFAMWQPSDVSFAETAATARGLGVAALPFFAQTMLAGVEADTGLWFVQALAGSASAGLFGAAAALAEIPSFLFAGLSRALFPSVARADAANDQVAVSRFATQGVRLALLVTVLGVAVIAATGKAVLEFVFSAAFAGAALTFTVLMVATCGRLVYATCADVLMACGKRRRVLVIVGSSAAAQVALMLLVVPRYGPVGAAACAAIGATLAAVAAVLSTDALVGRRIVLTLVRSAAGAAVVGVGLAYVKPAHLWLVPAYCVAAVVYGGLLWLLGEIDGEDIGSIRSARSR